MNRRVSQKLLAQYVQRNHRLLTVKHNVNKCGVAHYTVNFYRKNDCQPSQAPFPKHLLQTDLGRVPLYLNFQRRNISDKDILANVQQAKEAAPTAESTLSPDAYLPSFITDMYKDDSLMENMFVIPDFLVQFSQSKQVLFVQDAIMGLHEDFGLPWWSTIVLTGVTVRLLFLLPLGANQMRIKARLQKLEFYMDKFKAKLKEDQQEMIRHYRWPHNMMDDEFKQKVKNELNAQYKASKLHPNKVYYIVAIEAYVWMIISLALRNMCHALPPSVSATELYKELSFGGISIFTDLTMPDELMILPLIVHILNCMVIEAHQSFNPRREDKALHYAGAHMMNALFVPLSICATNAVTIFWITNTLGGLIQIYLLHLPTTLRVLRAPPLDRKRPYMFYYDLRKISSKKPPRKAKAPTKEIKELKQIKAT